MRKLATLLCLTFAVLLFGAGEAWSLPKCPGSFTWNTWTNCVGTLTSPDGDKYVGEFRDDNFNGQGTRTYASGNKYVGEWRNHLPHGQGTYTFTEFGNVAEGRWENGYLKELCVPKIN